LLIPGAKLKRAAGANDMPKLKPATQAARRDHILNAAQMCFARSGFHRTTMQDICKAAEVSPGALYVYFTSKEALIQGVCDRDRQQFADKIQYLGSAPDLLAALKGIAEHYFIEEPAHKRLFAVEMGVESTRNPAVAATHNAIDKFVQDSFAALFQRLKDEGRIAPALEIAAVTQVFHIMGEGLFWRRAIDPHFDAQAVLPGMMHTLAGLLNPISQPAPAMADPIVSPREYTTVNTAKGLPTAAVPRKTKKTEVSL
jgi:TetR/AcrR family transcriptional regulator, repressor for uid operon